MSIGGLFGAEKPKEADAGAETAKLKREREALMARSNIEANTTTTKPTGANVQPSNIFRQSLGK
jgi:hypothetical protein